VVQRFAQAIRAAREAGVPVVFVTVAWRDSRAEVSDLNRHIAPLAASKVFVERSPATEVDGRLAPQPGEAVVTKRRVGAFTGGDLELVLTEKVFPAHARVVTSQEWAAGLGG